MSSMVYMGQMELGGYTLTVITKTEAEAVEALRKEFDAWTRKEGKHWTRVLSQNPSGRTFDEWADFVGMSVQEMPLGQVEWL